MSTVVEQFKVGAKSLKVVVTAAGGTLSLHFDGAIRDPNMYSYVSFWVYPLSTAVGNLKVFLENDATAVSTAGVAMSASALSVNQWTRIRVPLSSIKGALTQFTRVNIGNNGTGMTYYLDEVVLESSGASASPAPTATPSPVPTPTPTPAPTPAPGSQFRGVNIGNMEMSYVNCTSGGSGPVEGTHYPKHDSRLIDYFASKNVGQLRILFSWECMQPTMNGPIPGSATGNYKKYFDNYKRIVDYATNTKGMMVTVEPWQANSGGGAGGAMYRGVLVGSATVPNSAFADFWNKMATIFKDNPKVTFGLVNEPNNQSTMQWWPAAQAAVTAIRASGATQRIFVPGNGYSGASTWTQNWYDTAATKRSNAYGWLNANGVGQPITDPLNNMVAEVHTYLDSGQGGGATDITSRTAARDQVSVVVNEANLRGYKVYLGEIGFYAGTTITGTSLPASEAWLDFINYFEANSNTLVGYSWWAAGAPGWWDDVAANGGGHYSVTPTNGTTFTGDTVNMIMIQGSF